MFPQANSRAVLSPDSGQAQCEQAIMGMQISGQSEQVFTQAPGNQLKQESAEVAGEGQSVLDMVKAKWAEV